ncbi:MAG: hypothetical protein WCE75_01115 [Terracidiphilus sp.]
MIKDPNQTEQTPYELLRLPFDAPLAAVHGALPRFIREQGIRAPQLIGPAQQAQKKLQSSSGRAELDIWLYDVQVTAEAGEQAAAPVFDDLGRPRAVDPSQLYCLLDDTSRPVPQRAIAPERMEFEDLPEFDSRSAARFVPEFDR